MSSKSEFKCHKNSYIMVSSTLVLMFSVGFFLTLSFLLTNSYLSFNTTLSHFLYFYYPPFTYHFCLANIHVPSFGSCTLIFLWGLSPHPFPSQMVWVELMEVGMLLKLNQAWWIKGWTYDLISSSRSQSQGFNCNCWTKRSAWPVGVSKLLECEPRATASHPWHLLETASLRIKPTQRRTREWGKGDLLISVGLIWSQLQPLKKS